MIRRRIAMGGILGATLLGCSLPLDPAELVGLGVAERRWSERGFTDYSFEMQETCFCNRVGWYAVSVRGDSVVLVVPQGSGDPVGPERLVEWPTVDGLFELIRHAADSRSVYERLDVAFDPDLGYPTRIETFSKPHVYDAGFLMHVRNLRPDLMPQ